MTLAKWQRSTETALTVAALVFLLAFAVPIIWPQIPPIAHQISSWLSWLTWGFFALDLFVRLYLAEDRRKYFAEHLVDLIVVLLPLLRPLRLLRLVTLLSILNRRATSSLQGRILTYAIGATVLLGFCAALAALDAERDAPGSTITTLGDALWWALTTATTVGYGDTYPITATGQLVAAGLMLGGIAILGTVTATVSSWLVEQVRDSAMDTQIQDLTAKVDALTAALAAQVTSSKGPEAAPAPLVDSDSAEPASPDLTS